jgi:hypothetical protein
MGVTVYADDVVILAPTRNALSEMLKVTERFAQEYKIVFSTNDDPSKSKSKCIYMTGKEEILRYPAPLLLNGQALALGPGKAGAQPLPAMEGRPGGGTGSTIAVPPTSILFRTFHDSAAPACQ